MYAHTLEIVILGVHVDSKHMRSYPFKCSTEEDFLIER